MLETEESPALTAEAPPPNLPGPLGADAGGIAHLARVAFPLIMVTSGHAIRLFSDRVMLADYSADSLKASLSAGVASFTVTCFFLGLTSYTNTFVAQYTGAGREREAGRAVWQGIYLALAGALAILGLTAFAQPFFAWFGHEASVQPLEIAYFKTMNSFSLFPLLLCAIFSFWSGRGLTWTVMAVELPMSILNVGLNWVFIFGNFGFPPMGVFGAALATGVSTLIGCAAATALLLRRENRRRFGTWPEKTFHLAFLLRMVRFGLPNGVQFFLDLASFCLFVNLVSALSPLAHEASAVAFSVNAIVFIPMIGLGMGLTVIVGQSIGARRAPVAVRAFHRACLLVALYAALVLFVIIAWPQLVLGFFGNTGGESHPEALATARLLLYYIAAYIFFDGIWIMLNAVLKGAGDTRFAMRAGVAMAWGVFALPSYLAQRNGATLWQMWGIFVCYILVCCTVFSFRYRGGRWKSMRVIED